MLLKLDNIGKIYDSDDIFTIGIRGVSLEFDYNEFVTVEGESGAGKSTLLNIIGANDTYEEGELYINGEETSHFGESDWEKYREKNIATIFQDFNIIENLTVLENIELALLRIEDKKKRRKIARDLIERVGLTQQINQKGSRLSGGEKQRTVIARALAKDAPIILADEPTGNLDVKASREVAALLKEVANDKLVIVVTHNPEFFVEYATRRIKMYDGGVAEDKHVVSPPLTQTSAKAETDVPDEEGSRFRNIKNVLHIGVLNYKSRPRFTMMMTLALFVCAITLLIVLSVFGKMLILPVRTTLDDVGVEGKVIVTAGGDKISADVAKLPFEDGSYDRVVSFESIYFWQNPVAAMQEISRVLKVGGRLVIATEMSDPVKGKKWADRCDGMTVYTAEQLAAFFEKAGFSDVKVHKTRKVWCVVEGVKAESGIASSTRPDR